MANHAVRVIAALGFLASGVQAQDLGLLDGGVNEVRGTAFFRVPIVVPPGAAGHTPDMALVYSSEKVTGGAGWVGVGWGVTGLSAIERDRKFGVPYNYNAACLDTYCYRDDFVLDGGDLLCENPTCPGGGRYRTQVDDGREITYLGATSGWRIRDREGRTLVYGQSESARNVNPKNGQVFAWLLEDVVDASGNTIHYAYAAGTGLRYLDEVSYGQGVSANRRVKLHRQTRPDVALDYTAGFRQQVDQRLSQVEVRAGAGSGGLVTRYDLTYAQAPDSNRSLLASVQRSGSNGTSSLPPWEFDYQTSAHTFGPLTTYKSGPVDYSSSLVVSHANYGGGLPSSGSIDLNGDALPDYLHIDVAYNNTPPAGPGTRWIPNLGLAVNDPNQNPPSPGFLHTYKQWSSSVFYLSESVSGATYKQLIDMDGDRFTDALGGGQVDGNPCPWTVRRGDGAGFSSIASPWQNVPIHAAGGVGDWCKMADGFNSPFTQQLVALVDLTGDGRPERVLSAHSHSGSWQVAINYGWNAATGAGSFSSLKTWPDPSLGVVQETHGSGSVSPLLLDVNGDGLADHVYGNSSGSAPWQVAYNFGGGFEAPVALAGPGFAELRKLMLCCGVFADVLDINGDGLPDRLESLGSPARVDVWFGTGTGFKSSPVTWQPGAGSWGVAGGDSPLSRWPDSYMWISGIELRDLNGDGLVDRAERFFKHPDGEVTFNAGPFPDVMNAASSPLGGLVQYEYGAAANQPNAAGTATANGNLPMPRWVVTKSTRSDGRVGTPQVADTYLYRNAGYDRAEREFRGFGEVVQSSLLPGGAAESTATSTYQTDRACGGQLGARTLAGGGLTYAQESHTYVTTSPQPASADPTRQWVACLPSESLVTAVEGGSGPARTQKTAREYGTPINPEYNVTVLREWGAWDPNTGPPGGVDIPGDERFTFYEYATMTDANYYVVSLPTRIEVKDGAGVLASLARSAYDGNADPNNPIATRGRLTVVEGRLDSPAPAWVRQATLAYDGYGNVTSRTGPTTTYDGNGFQEATTFDGEYQTFPIQLRQGSDTATPLTTTIAYTGCLDGIAPPPALGLPCTITSPQGVAQSFRYDSLARLDKLVRPSGLRELVSYTPPDPNGPAETLVQRTLDFTSGSVPDLVFKQLLDGFGRAYREESPGKANETIVTTRTFDARGRLATETQPHFSTLPTPLQRVLGYDPLGRVKSVLDVDGTTQRILAYKPWEVIEETWFGTLADPNHRKAREESAFDGLGRVAEVRNYKDAVNLGSPFSIKALYDAADRLLQVQDPVEAAPGAASDFCDQNQMPAPCGTQQHITQVAWDTLGRKLAITDPDAGTWTYEYYDSGKLKVQTNGSGKSLEWIYDEFERMVLQTVNPAGNGSANANFFYDAPPGPDYGLLKRVDAETDYIYTRDTAGRLATLRQTTPTQAGTFWGERYWTYDELDRVATFIFPEGTTFQNVYDGLRLVRIQGVYQNYFPLVAATYDAFGRPVDLDVGSTTPTSPPRATLDYEYTGPGARLSRILAKRHPDAGPQTVMDVAYQFDGLGRLTDQVGSFNGQNVDRDFEYDGLGRLTEATGPWNASQPGTNVTWNVTYDPLGNLRSLAGTGGYTRTWTYAHAAKPRLLTRWSESTDPTADDMTADLGGNLTEINHGGISSFAWNAQNRLYSGNYATLSYDAFGRRVKLHHHGGSWQTNVISMGDEYEYNTYLSQSNLHFFVGGQRIASIATYADLEYGSTWGWWIERVGPPFAGFVLLLGLAGLVALARRRPVPAWLGASGVGLLGAGIVLLPIPVSGTSGGSPYPLGSHGETGGVYYLTDHLGSTRAAINQSGSQLESWDYDPFGRTIAHTGEMNLKHRFTGQPVHETDYNAVNPLYNYGARLYQPKWGRFISADEIVEGFDSQNLGRHSYVRNAPTSLRDPSGRMSIGGITDVLDQAYFYGRWSQDVGADMERRAASSADQAAARRFEIRAVRAENAGDDGAFEAEIGARGLDSDATYTVGAGGGILLVGGVEVQIKANAQWQVRIFGGLGIGGRFGAWGMGSETLSAEDVVPGQAQPYAYDWGTQTYFQLGYLTGGAEVSGSDPSLTYALGGTIPFLPASAFVCAPCGSAYIDGPLFLDLMSRTGHAEFSPPFILP